MRNKLYLLMSLLIVAMLTAACGEAAPSVEEAQEAVEEAAAEVEEAAEAAVEEAQEVAEEAEAAVEEAVEEAAEAVEEAMGSAEDDPLGTVVVAPGDPIRIASALVIAGPNETIGIDSQTGVEIAIKQRGEVTGHPVELIPEDGACSAEGGQTAATKIASDDSIVAVVGHSCSSSCTPAAPIYNDAGLVMISPSCTAPALTSDGHVESFLRTAHNDNVQGQVMAEFVFNELGLTTAATIHDGSPYAEQLQQVFANTFTELGGTLTAQEAINAGDTDMRPVLTSIATASPEFLYYPIFIAEGGFITTQAKEINGLEETRLGGADGMISPDFIAAAGDAANGMYVSGPNLEFTGETYEQFLTDYIEILGQEPGSAYHAHSYDAANMIFDAIEVVATTDAEGNTVIGKQALRDALYATSGLAGITGTIGCNESGDCANPEIVINEIQDGEYVLIFGGEMAAEGEAMEATEEEAMAEGEASEEAMAEGEAMEEEAMSLEIEPVRIALVMPSAVTDLAWSQSIYDAVLEIQEAAGGEEVVEIAFTEGMFNVTDAAAAIRDYAADDYNIVIAHGTQYGSSMFEIVPDFPDTTFVWGTATDTGESEGLENIFAYEARAEEGGYVNGVLAATISESGVLGVVGPVEAGDAKLYIDGFIAGAEATNPDITINVSYTGSFGDTALAAEAANTHINAGADVLTGSAQQVVGAIGVAQEQGIPWMATQADQSSLAPDIVVATQLYDWTNILVDIIQKHQAGELGGTAYALTLENGGLRMVYNEDIAGADAVAIATEADVAITAGEISVDVE